MNQQDKTKLIIEILDAATHMSYHSIDAGLTMNELPGEVLVPLATLLNKLHDNMVNKLEQKNV